MSEFFLLIILSQDIFSLTKRLFWSKSAELTSVPNYYKFQAFRDTGYALFIIFYMVPNSPSATTEQVTFIILLEEFVSH